MQYRPLGPAGIEASVVGFGAWAIGGWMWGGNDDDQAVRAIHAAIDAGVNLIDTAPVYGFGHSEKIVGRAIADRRDRVVLATKCGLNWRDTDGEHFFDTDDPRALVDTDRSSTGIYKNLRPASIRHELEQSLQRLSVEHVELYQTHWQDATTPIEDTMAELLKMKDEGKIRAIGVSNATPQQMDAYRSVGQLDADQEPFSMLDRDSETTKLPYCHQHGLALLAYSPMARGLLTGKITADREFEEGDQRRDNDRFGGENLRKVHAMLDEYRPIAEEHGITLAQLAVAWAIARPGCTHALCGARNEKQARENAAAGDVNLTPAQLTRINDAIRKHNPD